MKIYNGEKRDDILRPRLSARYRSLRCYRTHLTADIWLRFSLPKPPFEWLRISAIRYTKAKSLEELNETIEN